MTRVMTLAATQQPFRNHLCHELIIYPYPSKFISHPCWSLLLIPLHIMTFCMSTFLSRIHSFHFSIHHFPQLRLFFFLMNKAI